MEEAADPAVCSLGEREHGAGDVKVVDRHREPAFGLATAPRGGDGFEVGLERRADLLCSDDAERIAGLAEPRDRLAHLADRAPLERELLRQQHRLLPHRHGFEPELAVPLEVLLGRAHHRQPPPVRARAAPQFGEQQVDLGVVADGIAADEGRPRDDAVGEESAAGRREEVALVAPQREEGKAVAAVSLDQRARHAALPHRLGDGVAERPQPEVEGEEAEGDAEPEEPVARAVSQLDAAQLRADDDRGDACERGAETEQRPDARRVTRHVEASPVTHERDEQEQRDRRLLEVEALRQMRDGRGHDDRDRELPGAPPALGERPREPDQADREGDRENARRLRPAGRQDAAGDPEPVGHLRRQRRDDPDHADGGCGPGEKPFGAGRAQDHAARVQRVHEGIGREPRPGSRRRLDPDPATALDDLAARARHRPARAVDALSDLHAALTARDRSTHDLACVGYDVGLTVSFAATAWAAFRGSQWLVPLAAVTGTMLVCDAWFDVVTSQPGGETWEAVAQAAFAELPLAAVCAFIVYDAETFLAATVTRFRR